MQPDRPDGTHTLPAYQRGPSWRSGRRRAERVPENKGWGIARACGEPSDTAHGFRMGVECRVGSVLATYTTFSWQLCPEKAPA